MTSSREVVDCRAISKLAGWQATGHWPTGASDREKGDLSPTRRNLGVAEERRKRFTMGVE